MRPSTRATTPAALVEPKRWERLVRRNLDSAVSLPESLLQARLDRWSSLPQGERVARWAQLFAQRSDNSYCFGLKAGGYVADSLLVNDFKLDCVSLFYRCTELARARSPRQALEVALATRFKGGDPMHVVPPDGSVDYHDASHLDYSEDMVRSGVWGRDVTDEVGESIADSAGTKREPAGSMRYIPTARLRLDRLREGDLIYFVLSEHTDHGRKLRQEIGTAIGHQAIVHRDHGTVFSIHAAAKPLSGLYQGNRVVQVPLLTYLRRVENFKGIMVTRLEDASASRGSY